MSARSSGVTLQPPSVRRPGGPGTIHRLVRRPSVGKLIASVGCSVLLYLLWCLALRLALNLPPVPATAAILLILATFLWLYLVRVTVPTSATPSTGMGYAAWLRLAAIAPAWGCMKVGLFWLAGGAGSAGHGASTHALADARVGWLPTLLCTVVLIPLLEEFFFRGHIQERLRRLLGIAPAIVLSAMIPVVLHPHSPWRLCALLNGLVCGSAVGLTRSVWAGVLMSSAGNVSLGIYALLAARAGVVSRPPDPAVVWVLVTTAALVILWLTVPVWTHGKPEPGRSTCPHLPLRPRSRPRARLQPVAHGD